MMKNITTLFIIAFVTISCSNVNNNNSAAACLADGGETLVVSFPNNQSNDIFFHDGRPAVGCCTKGLFSIEIMQGGRVAKRCAFLGFPPEANTVRMLPGQRRSFEYSAGGVSRAYCGIDLTKSEVSLIYGLPAGNELNVVRSMRVAKSCGKKDRDTHK